MSPRQPELQSLVKEIDRWANHADSAGSKSFTIGPRRKELYEELQKYLKAAIKEPWRKLLKLEFVEPDCVKVDLTDEALQSRDRSKAPKSQSQPKLLDFIKQHAGTPKKRRVIVMSKQSELPAPLPQELPASQGLECVGIRVYLSDMLTLQQEEFATSWVPAFGGSVVSDVRDCTHAVFPDDGQMRMRSDWEDLWPKAQEVLRTGGQLVSMKWLKDLIEAKTGSDERSCRDYIPSHFQQQMVHGDEPRRVVRLQRVKTPDSTSLTKSLQQTRKLLEQQEEEDFQKAVAASLQISVASSQSSAEQVLGVRKGASTEEIRAAYKQKALTSHPDKGGDSASFGQVRDAYLVLMGDVDTVQGSLPELTNEASSTGDFQLRNHQALVSELFTKDGADLDRALTRLEEATKALGLEPKNLGAVNQNERGEDIYNQCFYLSLARSYLGTDSDSVKDSALILKRQIETAVLRAHPDWGGSRVGEELQAFSDFLFYVMGTHALWSELSVAIFDSTCGGVELYIGRHYSSSSEQGSNLLTLRYTPGHYEALVGRRPTLAELTKTLEKYDVPCVPTQV